MSKGPEIKYIFRIAFLLFAGYVDAATIFSKNCGSGGSAPDQNCGRDKKEDDILWASRCFRKVWEIDYARKENNNYKKV